MPKADDIIKTASGEVGITEYPPNSNNVKYNTAFYGHAVQDGRPKAGDRYPWCAAFVWWVFSQHSPCLVKKTASCINLAQWFKDNGRWGATPHPGDVVFFKFGKNDRWTDHVGIVRAVRGSAIETIEGNTSIANNDNGGAVMVRTRMANIVGYGRPAYNEKPEVAPVQPQMTKRPPEKYKWGMDVSKYQGVIDYGIVKKAGISFVVIRATTKSGATDQYFERNYSECVTHKIDYSCYKLSYALTPEQARNEADMVIRLIRNRRMMVWLDLEDESQLVLGKAGLESIALAFMEKCFVAGIRCGIYCSLDWYRNMISDHLKKNCLFWIARTPKEDIGMFEENRKPEAANLYGWQYTHKGTVPGVNGPVDLDVILV